MPKLKKIVVQNWRNISLQELEFCPNLNCISGGNGEGKTNLLDAIYYLSMTRSAFSTSDRYNCRHGEESFAIAGEYDMREDVSARFCIKVEKESEKKVLRDNKPYDRISEHIGVLPVVMVSPQDGSLVSDSSDERRRFSNSVLSQTDPEFLAAVQRYTKLLANRNAILKSEISDKSVLVTIDERMDAHAAVIFEKRRKWVEELNPLVACYYEKISGGREQVGIEYRSDLQKGSLKDLLQESMFKDTAMRFTTVGVQRDDFIFTMGGEPIRKVGSQGQQKSFLVALKFAQYDIMKRRYGFPPILLLDDLFDKLDLRRTENLLKMVSGEDFGQIFISDTDRSRLAAIIGGITTESVFYEASKGEFTRI